MTSAHAFMTLDPAADDDPGPLDDHAGRFDDNAS
jgi:hypothetical protein